MNEILNLFFWYIILAGVGLLAFPIGFYFFGALSDRGYALTRTIGLLIWSYIFWLSGNLNFIRNDLGGLLFGLAGVMALSVWSITRTDRQEIRTWFRENRNLVITVEILMLVSFLLMAFLRANNPDITGTEKPMELAFINAILRSPRLPPLDPWLSGFSISYYHFGYIMVAMLAKISGTPGSIAFNLALATVFALAAIGSYGILYTLLERRKGPGQKPATRNHLKALLAPFFLLIVSNLEVVFHWMHNQGWFWRIQPDGTQVSAFWQWLAFDRLMSPPPTPTVPLDGQFWWWWQASRVVQDFNMQGRDFYVIDEFPTFSFILGDLHPHILAIPFVLLAIAFVLNFIFSKDSHQIKVWRWNLELSWETWIAASLIIGALTFLNTWDFPVYVALFCGAYLVKRMIAGERSWQKLTWEFILLGFLTGVASLIFYLPFFIGFSSQAGGLLPNVIFITRGVYLWIMFAPLLIPILAFLFYLWRGDPQREVLRQSIKIVLGLTLTLLALSFLLVLVIVVLPMFSGLNAQATIAPSAYLNMEQISADSWGSLIGEGLRRRLTVPGTLLTIGLILIFGFTLVLPSKMNSDQDGEPIGNGQHQVSNHFVLLMILVGAFLVFVPEFVYLRDLFGYRLNTVFKFYFQTWILWSLASAYIVAVLWKNLTGIWKPVFQGIVVVVTGLTLLYPYFGFLERTNHFQPAKGLTLDGAAYLENTSPDEVLAIDWLKDAPLGVIAEAVGGSYSQYARFSVHTGLPTVLGWDFHEIQWRGTSERLGSRRSDIETLYCGPRWEEASNVISNYEIRYIVVGALERTTYTQNNPNCPNGLQEDKFIENLTLAYENGSVRIYVVP